jgi:hypothetical protein
MGMESDVSGIIIIIITTTTTLTKKSPLLDSVRSHFNMVQPLHAASVKNIFNAVSEARQVN